LFQARVLVRIGWRLQGDQKFRQKFAQILEKVAKTIAKLKKCIRIFIKAQFKSSKSLCQTSSELLKCLQQTIFFPPKKLPQPLKNSPNGEISPNLVTLLEKLAKDKP
jgi:hypothetical protein